MKTITFSVSGKDAVVELGIDSFAKATGWVPTVMIEDLEVDNPITIEQHCGEKLFGYIAEVVKAYSANLGAEWGRQQSLEQIESQLKTITHTLHI